MSNKTHATYFGLERLAGESGRDYEHRAREHAASLTSAERRLLLAEARQSPGWSSSLEYRYLKEAEQEAVARSLSPLERLRRLRDDYSFERFDDREPEDFIDPFVLLETAIADLEAEAQERALRAPRGRLGALSALDCFAGSSLASARGGQA